MTEVPLNELCDHHIAQPLGGTRAGAGLHFNPFL